MLTAAKECILETGTQNDDGSVLTIKQSDYQKFLSEQGIPKPIQEKLTELETAFTSASIEVGTEKLRDRIDQFKKDGKAPSDATFTVKVMKPIGKDEVRITGCRTFPNPQNPGTHIERYGHINYTATRNRMICDSDIVKTQDSIKSHILGK